LKGKGKKILDREALGGKKKKEGRRKGDLPIPVFGPKKRSDISSRGERGGGKRRKINRQGGEFARQGKGGGEKEKGAYSVLSYAEINSLIFYL